MLGIIGFKKMKYMVSFIYILDSSNSSFDLASSVLALDATETVSQTKTKMVVELVKAQNLRLRSQTVMEMSSNDTLISFKKWYWVKK